jgi:hypothetical protein
MLNQMVPPLHNLIMSHLRRNSAALVTGEPSADDYFEALARWLASAPPIVCPPATTTTTAASWVNTPTPQGGGGPPTEAAAVKRDPSLR